MKHQQPFRFKQFEVHHHRCAMKVNTDGVLLGAWVTAAGAKRALDVGTGSGVIALMLAQRGVAEVQAIEIDPEAAAQAQENFEASAWAGKLQAHPMALQQFNPTEPFDLIISNPPYFDNAYKTPLANRNLARHNDTLPLADLMAFAAQWLTPAGRLSVILPLEMEHTATSVARQHGLFVARSCYVRGRVGGEVKRVLLEFVKAAVPVEQTTLAIETAPLQYTDEYRALTKDFYLKG